MKWWTQDSGCCCQQATWLATPTARLGALSADLALPGTSIVNVGKCSCLRHSSQNLAQLLLPLQTVGGRRRQHHVVISAQNHACISTVKLLPIDMPQRDDRFHMLGDVLRRSLKEFVQICLRQPNGAHHQNTHILLTDLLTDLLTCAVAKILSIGFTAPHSIRCTAKAKDGQKYTSSTHHHTHNHGAVHD